MSRPFPQEAYAARIAFMVELAEHLHAYGTTTPRLEGALELVAQRLGLECEPWTNPTGMVLSFSDPMRPPGDGDATRVLRLPPGENDLGRLCDVDRIAEDVLAGRIGLAEGHAALRALDRPLTRRQNLMQVLGFGLAAVGIAGLLRLPWLDIGTAAVVGLVIGLLQVAARTRPRLREANDAVSAMVAAAITIMVAAWVAPLNLNTVIISALIVLMPGLALTNAVNELTSQHLMSGTARFAGAVATMIMLTVGTMVAMVGMEMLGVVPQVRAWRPQPDWVEWCGLAVASIAFAVLFRAKGRDWLLVALAAATGYLVSRKAGLAWGAEFGIFLAALVVTAAGNGYARWAWRPGAVVRVPGIILMVPGSASVRTLITSVQQQDVAAGQSAAMAVINILLSIVAGLIFGNLLLPARRNL
ncbi:MULTISPECIES: threonine/serine exporter family protein [unclassified Luteimonas]|uniref:threonine/serine ThrE exporter family protein n=1 Tax=unclassified Luteimonas TaxID=2629088 RepID=UPI0018F09371|nr:MULTISPECIES: threonine/serine exporter family protein [unclassified Luteimonas]MBJ6978574.1 threonine/serine exporter family protein [Luteimonas sp. MC1895]MBJ6983471.1 threonine/serine exporter family protein [Luteimonas sp. MC1750]QQO06322.1 threonine/serine exporter family protein [Luteimonas sp. MC1750]